MGILSWITGKGNNLYYPGCLTKFVLQDKLDNYKEILNLLGIDFILIPEMKCCGSPPLNAGYEKESYDLAKQNAELLQKRKVGKIITNCPACYKVFSQDYRQLLKSQNWSIEVEHITVTILNRLKEKPTLIKSQVSEKIIYHDPCHLGRHSKIYEEPREVLKMLGYTVLEMRNNRQNSLCCGGGAGVKSNFPEISNNIAKQVLRQAKVAGATTIVSTCPLCFSQFKENFKDSGIEVIEYSDAVLAALK
jgi:heterodisulfide reductase subunit D